MVQPSEPGLAARTPYALETFIEGLLARLRRAIATWDASPHTPDDLAGMLTEVSMVSELLEAVVSVGPVRSAVLEVDAGAAMALVALHDRRASYTYTKIPSAPSVTVDVNETPREG